MDKDQLAKRIKNLRIKSGMSQEYLAEESGLSLRTIQRIENGETNPTADSLKRLSNALNANPDDLLDWAIIEDNKYLNYLNLSALTFLFFPLLGIIIPFMMWSSKRGKIKNIDKLGKDLINFEITWTILLCALPLIFVLIAQFGFIESMSLKAIFITILTMYGVNLIFILCNSFRINNDQEVKYQPRFKFLK
ncbi:MAG: hypothetical protein BM564_13525 [Bacteroidetes bacterium MedPE-SWsnd-G2]|nr:MAG: hypothetical protein BM564_13525 [Bacteroidetes bacterium MedPE-SWsnd-G2]